MQLRSIDGELLAFESAVKPTVSSMNSSYSSLSSTLSSINSVFTTQLSNLSSYFESNGSSSLQGEIISLKSNYDNAKLLCDNTLKQILNDVDKLLTGIDDLKKMLESVNNAIAHYKMLCSLSDEELIKSGDSISVAYDTAKALCDSFDKLQESLRLELSNLRGVSRKASSLSPSSSLNYNNLHIIDSELKELSFEYNGQVHKYLLYVPVLEEGEVSLPLITFFHGTGENSTEFDRLKNTDIAKLLNGKKDYPAYVLLPLKRGKEDGGAVWRSDETLDIIDALTEKVINEYPIDTKHMAITGHSDGGTGVYSMVSRHPNRYSVAVPFSCSMGQETYAENIATGNTDFYIFHGTKDDSTDWNRGKASFNMLKRHGVENAEFYPLQGEGHSIVGKIFVEQDYINVMLDKMFNKD